MAGESDNSYGVYATSFSSVGVYVTGGSEGVYAEGASNGVHAQTFSGSDSSVWGQNPGGGYMIVPLSAANKFSIRSHLTATGQV